jgi:hypothetical protein
VRSYRTFSPLPRAMKPKAVSSLWHLPSLSLEAQIPDVIRHTALRSSDFPLPKRASASAAIAQLTCTSMLAHLKPFVLTPQIRDRAGEAGKEPQGPPLRFAPVGMTILLCAKSFSGKYLPPPQNCHPDRSEA